MLKKQFKAKEFEDVKLGKEDSDLKQDQTERKRYLIYLFKVTKILRQRTERKKGNARGGEDEDEEMDEDEDMDEDEGPGSKKKNNGYRVSFTPIRERIPGLSYGHPTYDEALFVCRNVAVLIYFSRSCCSCLRLPTKGT